MLEESKENNVKNSQIKGARILKNINTSAGGYDYEAEADWIILRKDEKPRAEMFFVRYTRVAEDTSDRPVTFVFNGGPGASSVYLHMGAAGPKRVELQDNGIPAAPPYKLSDNEETWLNFTDLVFIDPIGTGFSRLIEKDSAESAKNGEKSAGGEEKDEYWKVIRDLESLCEFVRKYLSKYSRWDSPVYLAGESYGGFRVARLVKMLQQDYGVGIRGAVLISPALEFNLLSGSSYDALHWVDTFPVMAGAAASHGKSAKMGKQDSLGAVRKKAESFVITELLPYLVSGDMIPAPRRRKIIAEAARYTGIPAEVLERNRGRLGFDFFARNLLRNERKILGLYDSSLAVDDPTPEKDGYEGPEPTLNMLDRVFAAGINTQLRKEIGLDTERDYELLSMKVNESWDVDTKQHALERRVGSADELRYGISLNTGMKVFITHGTFDLVTPYFATDRITAQMNLPEDLKKNLTVKHYSGGHMFYARTDSRLEFYKDLEDFYSEN